MIIKNTPLLGAHISITNGFDTSIKEAEFIGCNAIQFFSKSNRQWYTKPLTDTTIELFKDTLAASTIQSTTIHASYLINIGSPNQQISKKSTDALKDELVRAQQLGVNHLVFHPGAYTNGSIAQSLNRIGDNINEILSEEIGATKLLLETMAGQGTSIGSTFEQLAHIYSIVEKKAQVGFCIDTCHIFAAGYNISYEIGYQEVMKAFDDIIGIKNLHLIHINDSKKTLGSNVDRHEHIGQGFLGLPAFNYLLNDERLAHVPKILETPASINRDHINNLLILKKLVAE